MHIITRMILGGAQENTLLTVEGLSGYDEFAPLLVTGPALGPEGELLCRAKKKGLTTILVPRMRRSLNPMRDYAAYRRLCKIIRAEKPDIVHTHSSKAGILGRLAARKCGVPAIVHTIHGLPFHPYQGEALNRLYIGLEKFAAKKCDRIITVADAMTDQAVEAGVAEREKFETIYSGLETEFFRPIDEDARREIRSGLGFSDDDKVICKVARLFHLKGHKYLLEAMPEILKKIPEAKLLFVGDGILRRSLESTARKSGLADKIVFTGLVAPEELGKLLAASDIAVQCSLREGLARVLPQAMLSEVPVVSYDIDGAREVVKNGLTGRLVGPRNKQELISAVTGMLADDEARAEMGRRGRALCEKMFDHKIMTAKIAALYKRLIHKKGIPWP